MNWKELCTEYETELRNGPTNSTAATVFTSKTEEGNKRWKDLKVRVVEHVSIYHIIFKYQEMTVFYSVECFNLKFKRFIVICILKYLGIS